jgi:hypothetical protein
MSVTPEQWAAFLTTAQLLQPSATPLATPNGVKGRFIRVLVDKLCEFWTTHQATLIPYLTQLAVAALNALVAARTDIDYVDPPGPR